jgi:hypothetical protein
MLESAWSLFLTLIMKEISTAYRTILHATPCEETAEADAHKTCETEELGISGGKEGQGR